MAFVTLRRLAHRREEALTIASEKIVIVPEIDVDVVAGAAMDWFDAPN